MAATPVPTRSATPAPTKTPTTAPTKTPTKAPTTAPTAKPSLAPTATPTGTTVSCTPKVNGATETVQATVTFYGWPDNSPPSNQIAYPVSGGYPTVHNVASGDGTYCNPSSMATEKSDLALFPIGTRIYISIIQKYFVLEDDCAHSGPAFGDGSNGCSLIWFDNWVGGSATDNPNAVVDCEDNLTPNGKQPVIVNPPNNLPVPLPGPIFTAVPGGKYTCNGKPVS
jgi:hypothetical protein